MFSSLPAGLFPGLQSSHVVNNIYVGTDRKIWDKENLPGSRLIDDCIITNLGKMYIDKTQEKQNLKRHGFCAKSLFEYGMKLWTNFLLKSSIFKKENGRNLCNHDTFLILV